MYAPRVLSVDSFTRHMYLTFCDKFENALNTFLVLFCSEYITNKASC